MHVVRKTVSLLLTGAVACALLASCGGKSNSTASTTPPTVGTFRVIYAKRPRASPASRLAAPQPAQKAPTAPRLPAMAGPLATRPPTPIRQRRQALRSRILCATGELHRHLDRDRRSRHNWHPNPSYSPSLTGHGSSRRRRHRRGRRKLGLDQRLQICQFHRRFQDAIYRQRIESAKRASKRGQLDQLGRKAMDVGRRRIRLGRNQRPAQRSLDVRPNRRPMDVGRRLQ